PPDSGEDNWMPFGSALSMDVTPFDTLRKSAKPVVSAVNGLCQGGGLQIAMCSDVAVVSDRATFRVPELYRGIADTYYSQMLARTVGPVRTRDLMLTGRTLTAAEAVEWGMVARVVPHQQLMDTARDVLAQCCRTAPGARRIVKASLDNYLGLYDRIGMEASIESAEAVEGFRAFVERRSPNWVHPELRVDGRL
uniref:enoyl-CoA hydratase/isomerase family protein n=1 Tax=uncultured Mycobacterium sp. TaxID=171292 RepID=UPI0035CAE4F7